MITTLNGSTVWWRKGEFSLAKKGDVFYPNPCTDYISIEFDAESLLKITLFDMLGKEVFTSNQIRSHFVIPSYIDKGSYIIQFSFKDGTASNKPLVVER